MARAPTQDTPPPPGWTRSTRRFALVLLALSAVLNQVDRQIISILVEPIKQEFHVSDTQMGLLTGIAFALVYALFAFPVAALLDRGVRRSIYAACIALWSASTIAAGLATSFPMLLAARIGVAAGESSSGPAQHSLTADLYPGPRLPAAMAFVTLGSAFGVSASLFFGGWLSEHLSWRAAFIAVGLPGLFVALLMRFAMPEPPRRTAAGATAVHRPTAQPAVLAELWAMKSYRTTLAVAGGITFSGYGMLAWAPALLMRVHHFSPSEVGLYYGLVSAGAFVVGATLAGTLGTILCRRDPRWYLRLIGGAGVLAATAGVTLSFAPTGARMLGAMFFVNISTTLSLTLIAALIQTIVRPHMRATAAAACLFAQSVIGGGLGPLVIGMLNDHFQPAHGLAAIQYSMACIMVGMAGAGLMAFIGARWIPADHARAVAVSDDADG